MLPLDAIRVSGLAELNKSLRKMSKDAPKQLRLVGNDAAEIVVDATKPDVPKDTGHAARTVRAASTRTAAQVRAGGPRAPYYPWLDFGGRVGPNRKTYRKFIKAGRYIHPNYVDNRDQVRERLEDGLVRVITASGLSLD